MKKTKIVCSLKFSSSVNAMLAQTLLSVVRSFEAPFVRSYLSLESAHEPVVRNNWARKQCLKQYRPRGIQSAWISNVYVSILYFSFVGLQCFFLMYISVPGWRGTRPAGVCATAVLRARDSPARASASACQRERTQRGQYTQICFFLNFVNKLCFNLFSPSGCPLDRCIYLKVTQCG